MKKKLTALQFKISTISRTVHRKVRIIADVITSEPKIAGDIGIEMFFGEGPFSAAGDAVLSRVMAQYAPGYRCVGT